jgi:hypothetical protein
MSRLKILIVTAMVAIMVVPGGAVLAQEEALFTGTAIISDGLLLSDSITYTMSNVPAPADGTEYVGWLISDDGSVKLSTGAMVVGADGTVAYTFDHNTNRYTGQNLIHNYRRVAITPEIIDADPDEPQAAPVFVDEIPQAAIDHIRHLLTNWPPGEPQGIFSNLTDQLDIAILHGNLARQSDTIDDIRLHTHHVINVIKGESSPNVDASFGNPGDGQGVLLHAQDRKHATFAANTVPGDALVKTHADLVEITGKHAEDLAIQARDSAVNNVLTQDDKDIAKIRLGTVVGLLETARDGVDADADGTIESTADEGATAQAIVQSQLMATYTFGAAAADTGFGSFGDPTIPLLAQIALIASIVLIVAGGALTLNARRSRTIA